MSVRPMTFVIAAADASPESKRKADRVLVPGETLDGVIQLIMVSGGGVVQLTEGHFEMDDWPIPNNVSFQGDE